MTIRCDQCRPLAGESASDAPSSARSCQLLSSYLLHRQKGAAWVRDMIVGDICCLRDLGAHRRADDLEAVLGCFLSRHPEAGSLPILLRGADARAAASA